MNTENILTPYQVGEYDVVAAYSKDGAAQLLADYVGCDSDEVSNDDIEDLTPKLNVMLKDEEGNDVETLGNWMKRVKEPEYLYGWD